MAGIWVPVWYGSVVLETRIGLILTRFDVQSTVFTVRNGGHSAGFDEEGALRIF